MSENGKSPMDLLSEIMLRIGGKKAERMVTLEQRRSINAQLFQLEQKLAMQDEGIASDEAAAVRYMREILSKSP